MALFREMVLMFLPFPARADDRGHWCLLNQTYLQKFSLSFLVLILRGDLLLTFLDIEINMLRKNIQEIIY